MASKFLRCNPLATDSIILFIITYESPTCNGDQPQDVALKREGKPTKQGKHITAGLTAADTTINEPRGGSNHSGVG